MNFALAIAVDNINYATVVYIYGRALCGVQQGAHGRVSSARQVWEANAIKESDSEPAKACLAPSAASADTNCYTSRS